MVTQQLDEEPPLTFAIPKKGRLFDRVHALLVGAGLDYVRPSRVDVAHCTHFPIRLVFLPASDIATYVAEGRVALGITGEDIIAEHQHTTHVTVLERLGFGQCQLGVQAPKTSHCTSPAALVGQRIVTSFPNITAAYFQALEADNDKDTPLTTKITRVSGSVEAACALGLADAVVDLIETGTTMTAAGLELISTIMQTEAVLIANRRRYEDSKDKISRIIHQRIRGYLTARKYCIVSYNIHRRRLPEAEKITPGRKSPTITQLAGIEGQYVAVSAMLLRDAAAETMDRLVEIDATDILILNIENCRV